MWTKSRNISDGGNDRGGGQHTRLYKQKFAWQNRDFVTVSCMYRTPVSNMETFWDLVDKTFTKSNQNMFICGDFTIDLLNPNIE